VGKEYAVLIDQIITQHRVSNYQSGPEPVASRTAPSAYPTANAAYASSAATKRWKEKNITCFRCGQGGHYKNECLSETELPPEEVRRIIATVTKGMSSGLVSLLYSGPAIGYINLPPYIEEANLLQDYMFTYFGPDTVGARPGLRGAPVVHEKSYDDKCDGAVIGFVRMNDSRDCIVTVLDEVLEDGWRLSRTDNVV
jgi:hypothetical protein